MAIKPVCTDKGDGKCNPPGGKVKALGLCSYHWDYRYNRGTLPEWPKCSLCGGPISFINTTGICSKTLDRKSVV